MRNIDENIIFNDFPKRTNIFKLSSNEKIPIINKYLIVFVITLFHEIII